MELYGRSWARREIEASVGRLEQVAGFQIKFEVGPVT